MLLSATAAGWWCWYMGGDISNGFPYFLQVQERRATQGTSSLQAGIFHSKEKCRDAVGTPDAHASWKSKDM